MNPLIFREYGIKGNADKDLDGHTVKTLGRGFGSQIIRQGGTTAALGRDVRTSSPRLRDAFIEGLVSAGLNVIDLGEIPAPLLYFAVSHLNVDAGVMIAGGHHPPEMNGFRMIAGKDVLNGEAIRELRYLIESRDFESGLGSIEEHDVLPDYKEYLKDNLVIDQPMRLVMDCGNGCAGLVAPELFKEMGCLVDVLYGEPDGTFPNHQPDPVVEANLQELIHRTRELGYDLGIAYDADAGRIGVVDDMGKILWGDQILIASSRSILKEHPGASIVGDVMCSQILYDDVKKNGGNPIMGKTGFPSIGKKMREEKALLGGDMSGHIFFNDNDFGFGDAIYTTGRLLEILCAEARPLSQLLWGLPTVYGTSEIRSDCPDEIKFDVVAKIEEYFKSQYNVVDVDGVRVIFNDGWGLIRASHSRPVISMRFEATSEVRLQEIRDLMESKVEEFKKQ
jgi:phosphomannomutase/phosphoglucomutase